MKKAFIFTASLCLSHSLYAAPIEQRNLSNANNTPDAAILQQNQQIWESKQQVQQLQNQVRQLLGKIEEQEYRLDQLNTELQNRYTDLDQRFEILTQKIEGESEETTDPQTTDTDTSTVEDKNPTPTEAKADEAAYNAAYESYKTGGAAKAIPPMQAFINTYPNSPYISHAYYWLGDFNLQIQPANYHEARDSFEVVAGNYPQSTKASPSLYRLIEIALSIDKDINKARSLYQQLIQKYPDSQEARTARATFGF